MEHIRQGTRKRSIEIYVDNVISTNLYSSYLLMFFVVFFSRGERGFFHTTNKFDKVLFNSSFQECRFQIFILTKHIKQGKQIDFFHTRVSDILT